MKKLEELFRPDTKYKVFFLSMTMFGLSYGLYKGVYDNYLAEIVSMSAFDKGVSEFFRELPGLALVFILAALYTMSAEKIYKIGAVFLLAGMAMHAIIPINQVLVILSVLVYSLGEHMQLSMRNTLSLEYSTEGHGGSALGVQNAIYQVGTLAGYMVVIFIFYMFESTLGLFRTVFWMSTAVIGLGFISSLYMSGHSETDKTKSRFYFRKKYKTYYMLELFYGARKQVFSTFGPYVLVLFYGANAMVISMLFAVSSICSFFASPVIGKIIDRFGYKIVMVADTLMLVVVCFFYGFAHHIFPMPAAFIICCINYVLDSVISLASMASNIYVQDLSENDDEVRATISTGLSVYHFITILIALFGGWIWVLI